LSGMIMAGGPFEQLDPIAKNVWFELGRFQIFGT